MKALRVVLLMVIVTVGPSMMAWGQGGTATPGSGLLGSAHDFTSTGVLPSPFPGGVGICTYCHTPHKAMSTLLLWNHTLSKNVFQWDVPTTTAGTPFPTIVGNTYNGPTAKCLSCHDGSVAIGDVAWFKEGPQVLDTTTHSSGEFNIGGGGNMQGNHPVAMPYPYQQARNTYNTSTTGINFTPSEWQPTPLPNIRVFNDDGKGNITAGAVLGKTGIECSSCHDPHNKAAVDDLFLRGMLTGSDTSYLCLKCHIK
jgi:hypothetical protein